MPTRTAYAIARHWASCRRHPPAAVHLEDIAEQVQAHLAHGASVDYLRRIAWWMATEHPAWYDLSLAMTMSGAPQPEATTAPVPAARGRTHRCPCRRALAPA